MRVFPVCLVAFTLSLLTPSGSFAASSTTLDAGLSHLHHAVSTTNPEAQRYFDQGMRYLYAFNHDASIASFKRAGELDPTLAMAWWGVALALGPNINLDVDPDREKQAFDAVQTAISKQASASAEEQALIAALARRYSSDPKADLKALAADYSGAMRQLHAKYPDDPDLATLFAESLMDLRPWKFWSHDGKPAEGTDEIVAVLRSVLAAHPDHLGANHYYIHATEASSHPEQAARSARRLETLAPSAGHLVHMPAHVYQRMGDYLGAARANELAARADRVFVGRTHDHGVYPMMYYNHNLQFGAASYAMAGNLHKAMKMAEEMSSNAMPMVREMPMLEALTIAPTMLLARFGLWTAVLRTKNPDAGPLSIAFGHAARAMALAGLGDVEGAKSEQRSFEAVRLKLTGATGVMQNSDIDVAAVAAALVSGRVALASGDTAGAIEILSKGVVLEDNLNYDEPADWPIPLRETLGATLLANGDPRAAERVFRDDLMHNAANPRSLFGLAAALKVQGRNAEATKASGAARHAWRGADTVLRLASH